MKTIAIQQGSEQWLAHRRTTRNASDAPAMMGASPYVSRAELVKRYATGIQPDVDAATQRIFDRGHAVEPALRAMAEQIIGDDLYPITGTSDDGYLGASFDGVTMDETVIAEFKQGNAGKAADVAAGVIPVADYWQIAQQFAVCESAQRCLYLVGDGGKDTTASLWIHRDAIAGDIPKLLAGWAQFDADVAAYQPEQSAPAPVAAPVAGFGALSLRVEGRVLASNLDAFRADADAFIQRLPKPAELQDDQDFADAESAVKACSEAEARIKAAKDAALAQMADVDAVLRAADEVAETIRAARLALDRAVKSEKEARKTALVRAGVESVSQHYATINATLAGYELSVPTTITAEIGGAIKGLKSLSSMRDKIDAAVARIKIESSQSAETIRQNAAILADAGHAQLFPDRAQLAFSKTPDDLRNLVTARIAEHERREAARLEAERERIRVEEQAKTEPASAGVAQPVEQLPSRQPVAGSTPAARSTIKLGQINAAIAPLSITADGLAQLGIKSVGKDRAAVLYAGEDATRIIDTLIARLMIAQIDVISEAA